MRFYTVQECEEWLAGRERVLHEKVPGVLTVQLSYPPSPGRILYYAQWIGSKITCREPTLLWITEWGIWPSSENWHIYYKLRQSYGDGHLLHESPGHFFLNFECEDLASFLQLAMLNGWGGYVLGPVNTTRADGVASDNRFKRGGISPRRAVATPQPRISTKHEPIFTATRRDGTNFPDFVVARRFSNRLQCAPRS